MRSVFFAICAFPTSLWATDIPVQSRITDVILYPQGATVTRVVPFEVPQGQHQLVLTDLPPETPLERVRVALEGAVMGSVTLRRDDLPVIEPPRSAAQQELYDRIEALEAELRAQKAERDLIAAEVTAAQARVAFLKHLGEGDGVAALGVEALRDLTGLVGDETLAALQESQEAGLRIESLDREIEETLEALKEVQQALAALTPGVPETRAMLSIGLGAEAPTTGQATITYTIDEAGWEPVYDLKLDRSARTVTLERGAFITQSSGESWEDVALTLSTVRPSEQTAPGEVWPWLRRIFDPSQDVVSPAPMVESMADFAPAAEAGLARRAVADFDGLAVRYSYPDAVTVANRADRVRIALGELSFPAEITAQAVPLADSSAFLMASIVNDAEELILPSTDVMLYRDGRFMGQGMLEMIPAGGTAKLAFGPIEGLRLTRTILDRNEGDRGLITRSSELTEEVVLQVENLTGETWPVRLLDRVPYSEQEDLQITWEADLAPTEQDVDGKRGVMAWAFDLPAGAERTITLRHSIAWPDGQVLQ